MNIMITGNMGYIGPVLLSEIRKKLGASVTGLDSGLFASCLLGATVLPERMIDRQIFKDVREVTKEDLRGIDAVVCLAALSNDPMGNCYGLQTIEINYGAVAKLAVMAKSVGVESFVFASSCSVYGFTEGGECDESSPVNPLTEYAKSKILSERFLESLADEAFHVTCFRFATACGASPRLRLDLVVNDFVASAIATGRIEILSDGTPWRPLIDVKDMSAAIIWALTRTCEDPYLLLNAGCNEWNFQIKDIAKIVQSIVKGVDVAINPEGQPDKRSYRVKFDRFHQLTQGLIPAKPFEMTIEEIYRSLTGAGFSDAGFRKSEYIRLNALRLLTEKNYLSPALKWL